MPLVEIETRARGALTEAQAEYYVGGRQVLKDLQAAFPELVVPFVQRPRVTLYRVAVLEDAMKTAEASGALRQ